MGYYTRYSLTFTCPEDEGPIKCPLCLTEKAVSRRDVVELAIREDVATEYGMSIARVLEESTKWYEHDADMREFSKRFPDVTFALQGIGEDAHDRWISYYKAGRSQSHNAVITYPETDEKDWK